MSEWMSEWVREREEKERERERERERDGGGGRHAIFLLHKVWTNKKRSWFTSWTPRQTKKFKGSEVDFRGIREPGDEEVTQARFVQASVSFCPPRNGKIARSNTYGALPWCSCNGGPANQNLMWAWRRARLLGLSLDVASHNTTLGRTPNALVKSFGLYLLRACFGSTLVTQLHFLGLERGREGRKNSFSFVLFKEEKNALCDETARTSWRFKMSLKERRGSTAEGFKYLRPRRFSLSYAVERFWCFFEDCKASIRGRTQAGDGCTENATRLNVQDHQL